MEDKVAQRGSSRSENVGKENLMRRPEIRKTPKKEEVMSSSGNLWESVNFTHVCLVAIEELRIGLSSRNW